MGGLPYCQERFALVQQPLWRVGKLASWRGCSLEIWQPTKKKGELTNEIYQPIVRVKK